MHNYFDAEDAFAFGIDLQCQLAIMHFEHRQIIRRCLDHDSVSPIAQFPAARTFPVSKDRLHAIQTQRNPRPVDERLENLFHRGSGLEQEIPAVLDLINGILILERTPLLFFQIEGE